MTPASFTLVTACMNREEHLRRSLPHWLSLPGIEEVIVVDWSNHRPLVGLCGLDPRVRVLRVENEPRWILSYAYNLGVSHAARENILKCDADCLPSADVTANVPGTEYFFAGFWKSGAAVGKPSVNGQCIFRKTQFKAVNGYSELIRTYGRDDEDFYDRMIAAGCVRREIPVSLLDFIEHTQEARVANQFAPTTAPGVAETVERDPLYNEMKNLFVSRQLPWSSSCVSATYTTVREGDRWTVVQRDKSKELAVPPDVEKAGRLFSLRHLVSVLTKTPQAALDRLDERACLAVLGARMRIPARSRET